MKRIPSSRVKSDSTGIVEKGFETSFRAAENFKKLWVVSCLERLPVMDGEVSFLPISE